MTRKKKIDSRQGDLLALLDGQSLPSPVPVSREAGALDMNQRLRQMLNAAIAASGMGREVIGDLVSQVAGRVVTKAMIDSWTGSSRPHRFPADLIPAFCAVLGNSLLLEGLASAVGCTITEGYSMQLARLGQLVVFINRARSQQDQIIADLPLYAGGMRHV